MQKCDAATCPKCGSKDVATSYHAGRWRCEPWSRFTNNSADSEHLHYTCRNCRFDWTGVTADADAEAVA